ncbi:MAG TPA: histidine phosphatase family protein [Oxalicibacterium sp.]|nr:histidine phosphatase family protein [Oxalicibacterium sp.]
MTDILLIRHGETDWNVEKRLQGHCDIALNAEGARQAAALGRALGAEPLDAIFSSDLQRARDTAQAIADARGMTVQTDPGLRERCFGAFEGLVHSEISERYPADFLAWKQRDLDARYTAGERQAETLREFSARALNSLTRLASLEGHRRIAVVSHGGVLDTLYRHAYGLGYEHARNFDVLNASINRLKWDGTRFHVLQWADVAHLAHTALDEADNAR